MSTQWRSGLAALSALAVGLGAGCGHALSVPAGSTVQVALGEYRLTPANLHLHPGALTIVATNVGRLTHNLVVSRGGRTVGSIRPLSPGQRGRVTLTLAPGSYLVGSTLLSDEALGLYGHLTVGR